MIRILLDQDFNHALLRGLRRRVPDLDFITARDADLSDADDRRLLRWAFENNRILFTHDIRTMPGHYAALLARGESVGGILIIPRRLLMGLVINELEIFVVCSDLDEWKNRLQILSV